MLKLRVDDFPGTKKMSMAGEENYLIVMELMVMNISCMEKEENCAKIVKV